MCLTYKIPGSFIEFEVYQNTSLFKLHNAVNDNNKHSSTSQKN